MPAARRARAHAPALPAAALSAAIVEVAPPTLALGWLAVVGVLVVQDQIALQPPPPPTAAEVAAAAPGARAEWRRVWPRLQARLPAIQPRPPELGAVWSTRRGRICGLVDRWDTGIDVMQPFYTVRGQPVFAADDEAAFVKVWLQCRFDQEVRLHTGTYDTGLCATRQGLRFPACRHMGEGGNG